MLLLDALPHLADQLEPRSLGSWPTQVEPFRGVGVEQLWVKRDDRSSELYGGSKVRNLEWLIGDAQARGHERLLTVAAWGSHMVCATALHGADQGLGLSALLLPQPIEDRDEVAQTLCRGLGAGAELSAVSPLRLADTLLRCRAALRRHDGRAPYWIAPGGASPIGSLGYVQAALEIRLQVEQGLMPKPDYIYCAAGSCGTLVGLAEGLALAGLDAQLVAVRVVPRSVTIWPRLRWMRAALRRRLVQAGASMSPKSRPRILHDQVGRGYAWSTEEARAIRERALAADGPVLEDTYTAKALAGLVAFVRRHSLQEKVHLFINTFDGRGPGDAEELPPLPPSWSDRLEGRRSNSD